MTIYQQAKQFVDMGVSVFPISYRAKTPAVPSWKVYQGRLPTDNELREWFPTGLRNYGIVLGWQKICTLDFDTMDAFYNWQMWTLDNTKALDDVYMSKTSRGMHVVFSLLEDLPNMKLPDCDFKTSGYIVGAGSTHPSGHVYKSLRPLYFPIVESLADVVPAEMLEQAIGANYKPVTPLDCASAPVRNLWELVDNPTPTTGALSPLEVIKSTWRIESFFPGVKPTGKFMRVICPFHDDKEPSAWVNIEKQLFGCHSCNMKPMSVIGFYAAMYTGGDIKQAMEKMR